MTITEQEEWDLEALRGAERYQRWILDEFGDSLSGRVLEVGAGNGNLTRWVSKKAEHVVAIEPDEKMCRELSELRLPNVKASQSLLEDFSANGQRFDSVMMINVLEHIEDDEAAMQSAKEVLRDGGSLCILVPAHPSLYAPLDKRYGHFRRYKKADIARKLQRSGFRVKTASYFNPLGALGWLFVFVLLRRKKVTKFSVKFSELVIIPLSRLMSRFGFRPFGQSVLAVGVKES